ncbi:NADP-reducing hydrogenase subunit HndA [Candidatus Brocadiaceae bacterium B188]|jgi:NADH-quinone oxidoreductase subunit E|nr:NADH-quinone oxidoreductase subunit NuoE [Candidatus Brocadiaceae bacterium]TWU50380.1 NADP-reducing hydrogenase subunit HndA [Candidatus Brocadiaceae bacterium B188]
MMHKPVTASEKSKPMADLTKCRDILAKCTSATSADLIPILQQIQDAYGYLPQNVLEEITARVRIPLSKIYGVITFYSQFSLEPRGKHTIKVCVGTACHIKGAPDIKKKITEVLHIQEGETTKDYKFTYEPVACLGTCFLAPVMMVNERYYGKLTTEKTEQILKSY